MSPFQLFIILSAVVIATSAQLFLKAGVEKVKVLNAGQLFDGTLSSLISVLFNNYILLGLALYTIGALAWIWVLSKVDISYAYPFVSLGFVMTLFIGAFAFNETLSFGKVLGVTFIVLGCIIIARA